MRVVIYEVLNSLNEKVLAPVLRKTGKRLYEIGSPPPTQAAPSRVTLSARTASLPVFAS